MQLTFLGTGGAQQVPVFGCDCAACLRARKNPAFRRQPCCAKLDYAGEVTLIDAGLSELAQQFTDGEIQRFWLTHYHMDHVQGLFTLRWGVGNAIPVYGPPDENGCDDLFRHPGILDFQPPFKPFTACQFGAIELIPLPLNHSKVTFGYLIKTERATVAYLTDTAGLPLATGQFLDGIKLDALILDCSHPPRDIPDKNHNDIHQALAIHRQLKPQKTYLTHISHRLDAWLMGNALEDNVIAAHDGLRLEW
ncbi:phosphonate metabolism protein PhnP [Ewingella sp. S1.OA.A_B6]